MSISIRFRSIICCCVLIGVLSIPALADSIVSINPSVSNIKVGSFFDVYVNIDSTTDLYAFQFDIDYDPAILSAQNITEGDFLPGGGATSFMAGDFSAPGIITFNGDSLTGAIAGVSGSGILATITFQALIEGTSSIGLSNVILLDSAFSDINYTAVDGSVNAVPEPGSLILLFTGLGAIGFVSLRKRK